MARTTQRQRRDAARCTPRHSGVFSASIQSMKPEMSKSIVRLVSDLERNCRALDAAQVTQTLRRKRARSLCRYVAGSGYLLPTQGLELAELDATAHTWPDRDEAYEARRPWRHQLQRQGSVLFADYMEQVGWARLLDQCLCGRSAATSEPLDAEARAVRERRRVRWLRNLPLQSAAERAVSSDSAQQATDATLAYALAYHPGTEVVAVGDQGGRVRLIDVDRTVQIAAEENGPIGVSRERALYVESENLVAFWNSCESNRAVFDVAWLPGATTNASGLAAAYASGVVDIVDVSTCSALGHKNRQRGWNRDWRYFQDYGGSEAPSPPVRVARLCGHHGAVRSIAPLPEDGGRIISTCGRDGNIFVYDLRSCRRLASSSSTALSGDNKTRNALLPVRAVQLGHFRNPAARRLVERGVASRADLLAPSPDRAIASVVWLGPDPSALLSAGATDGLLKVWDLRQTWSTCPLLSPEFEGGSLRAHRRLAKPVTTVQLAPGNGIAHAHLQHSCRRLAVATLRPGAPERGTVFILDPLQLGNARLSNGVVQSIQAPLWSHYTRVRPSPDGAYVAFGSGCDLIVADLGNLPAAHWELPAQVAGSDASPDRDDRFVRIACTGEVTALDWSSRCDGRIASVADLEPVKITQWTMAAAAALHEQRSPSVMSYASRGERRYRSHADRHASGDAEPSRSGRGAHDQASERVRRPIPCQCCEQIDVEPERLVTRLPCPRCMHERFCPVPRVRRSR